MPGNTFGHTFRLTSFGESHGPALGGVIDGCPAGLKMDMDFIQKELDRRRPGQSKIVSQRKEEDKVEFLSGIFEGKTTGTPIGFIIRNKDQEPKDYDHLKDVFRPSHGDYTHHVKYGNRDHRGGGRYSAREAVSRVVAGAVAKLILRQHNISIYAYTSQVGDIKLNKCHRDMDLNSIDDNVVRCPDKEVSEQMIKRIEEVRKEGDTIGGVVTGIILGAPVGLGEPVFDKLEADLGKAMLSIPAAKGFDCGWGFEGLGMKGSEYNDNLSPTLSEGEGEPARGISPSKKRGSGGVSLVSVSNDLNISFKTNYSGGIQGGISNGEDIYFRVVFKPVSTIMKKQMTVNAKGKEVEIVGKGRHDPCVLPRAVPVVEAMTALVLVDHLLRNKTTKQ